MENIKKGLLFILFAIPSAFAIFFGSIGIFIKVMDGKSTLPNPLLFLAVVVIGSFCLLYGIQKLRYWLYLFVFLTFPVSLVIWGFLVGGNQGMIPMLVFLAASAVGVLKLVDKYYRTQEKSSRS